MLIVTSKPKDFSGATSASCLLCVLRCSRLLWGCGQDRTWLFPLDGDRRALPDPAAQGLDASAPVASAGATGADAAAAPDAGGLGLPGAIPLQDWPLIPIGVESRQFSSFDRSGGNDDGFSGRFSALYIDQNEFVIFDALGPGRLNTLWFTSGAGGLRPLNVGQLRFYFDDEPLPRADVDSDRLFSGAEPGFPSDLVFDNLRSTGGYVSFVPMTFARRLKITTSAQPYFYNAQYDTFPIDTALQRWRADTGVSALQQAFAALLAQADAGAGAGPGDDAQDGSEQTVPLNTSFAGSGTLELLRIRLDPGSVAGLHDARIQITWDDQPAPAVDCPLDMFFGSGLGLAPVRALGFSIRPENAELVNRFPMPFWRGFQIAIRGVTGELSLRIGPERYPEHRSGYFHARYARESPPAPGEDFEYLVQRGAGKLVGTVLTVKPADPARDKGWWEGDLRSYADERRTPSIHGTGHEDDHLGGWSNRFFSSPFTLPLHGEPASQILDFNGQYNGNVSMYRLFPGIPFTREIRHSVEHGRANDRNADYSSTSFFYAAGEGWLNDSDQLLVCDADSRGAHAFVAEGESAALDLTSSFEGRAVRQAFSACHRTYLGAASFELQVSPENLGVYLRRLGDQSNARQRAKISIHGESAGEWYLVEGNSSARWSERDYFLPPRFTQGKSRLKLTISPAAGSPAWDAAEYRALSVVGDRIASSSER